jgi:hypothetical protein
LNPPRTALALALLILTGCQGATAPFPSVASSVPTSTTSTPSAKPLLKIDYRRTALDGYTIDVGHVDPRTRVWVVDNQQHHVHADDLRTAIHELT